MLRRKLLTQVSYITFHLCDVQNWLIFIYWRYSNYISSLQKFWPVQSMYSEYLSYKFWSIWPDFKQVTAVTNSSLKQYNYPDSEFLRISILSNTCVAYMEHILMVFRNWNYSTVQMHFIAQRKMGPKFFSSTHQCLTVFA